MKDYQDTREEVLNARWPGNNSDGPWEGERLLRNFNIILSQKPELGTIKAMPEFTNEGKLATEIDEVLAKQMDYLYEHFGAMRKKHGEDYGGYDATYPL